MHGNTRPGQKVFAPDGVRDLDLVADKFVEHEIILGARRDGRAHHIQRVGTRRRGYHANLFHIVQAIVAFGGGAIEGCRVGGRIEHQWRAQFSTGGGQLGIEVIDEGDARVGRAGGIGPVGHHA